MTFQALKREHPRRVCVCRPHLRDARNGRVISWICLQTFDSVNAAKAAMERFELNGATDTVLISTNNQITIEGDLAARYSKIFLGLEQ